MNQFQRAKIEDALLTELMKYSPFPPLDTAIGYQRLKSFDALLDCIGQASREGRPLHQVVGENVGNA